MILSRKMVQSDFQVLIVKNPSALGRTDHPTKSGWCVMPLNSDEERQSGPRRHPPRRITNLSRDCASKDSSWLGRYVSATMSRLTRRSFIHDALATPGVCRSCLLQRRSFSVSASTQAPPPPPSAGLAQLPSRQLLSVAGPDALK